MISTIYYVGSLYERETAGSTTTHRHHLYAGGQAIGQLKRTQAGVNSFEYFHRDHQGSVTKITNGAGSVIQSLSFDAFGKRRNADWSADPPGNRFNDTHATKLGYTGHEHLDNVRLIHMNGRVQDPTLGRFLSPDPFVQSPTNSQNFDRFGYTYNNPLSHTDPTGFIFKKIGRSVKKLGRAVVKVAIQSLRSAMGNEIMLFVADTTGNSWLRLAAQVFTNFALDKAEKKIMGSFNSTGSGGGGLDGTGGAAGQEGFQIAQLSSPRLRNLRERESIERESQRSRDVFSTGVMIGEFEVVVVGGLPSAQLSGLLASDAFRSTVQDAIRRLDLEQNLQNAPGAVGRRNEVLGTPVTTGQGFGDFGKPDQYLFRGGTIAVQHRGLGPVLELVSEHSQDALVFAMDPFQRDSSILEPGTARRFRERAGQAGAPSFVYSQEALRQRRIYVFEQDN